MQKNSLFLLKNTNFKLRVKFSKKRHFFKRKHFFLFAKGNFLNNLFFSSDFKKFKFPNKCRLD